MDGVPPDIAFRTESGPDPAAGWNVRLRTDGEVLATAMRTNGLELLLLGRPAGFTSEEVQAWLRELAGVACDTPQAGLAPTIPPVLHGALSGLLFYQAELWGRSDGVAPCTIALLDSGAEAALGWAGDGILSVHVQGSTTQPAWQIVHDGEGREARALVLDRRRGAQVRVSWQTREGTAQAELDWVPASRATQPVAHESAMAAAEPEWEAREPASASDATLDTGDEAHIASEPEQAEEVFEEPPAPETPRRSRPSPMWRFRGWVAKLRGGGRARPDEWVEPIEGVQPEPEAVEESWQPGPANEGVVAHELAEPGEAIAPALDPGPQVADPPAHDEAFALEPMVEGDDVETANAVPDEPTFGTVEPIDITLGAVEPDEPFEPPASPPVIAPFEPEVAQPSAQAEPGFADDDAAAARYLEIAEYRSHVIAEPMREPLEAVDEPQTLEAAGAPPTQRLHAADVDLDAMIPPSPEPESLARAAVPVFTTSLAQVPAQAARASAAAARATIGSQQEPSWLEPVEAAAPRRSTGAVPPALRGLDAPSRTPRAWPLAAPADEGRGSWPRAWPWAAAVLALVGIGWLVGTAGQRPRHPEHVSAGARLLVMLGLAPAQFTLEVTSEPQGAAIAIDGRDAGRTTPATLPLPVGTHQVTLSMPNLGSVNATVTGARGQRRSVDQPLWGALEIGAGDERLPMHVAVDGVDQGTAPVRVSRLMPGLHQVSLSGPGTAPWERTVSVRVNETAQFTAMPSASPANGAIDVRATVTTDAGSQPLSGAAVYVDGQLHGVTPLHLDLPRGPHSVRVSWHGETPPVQVIDLPGGNQRYADFELGAAVTPPRLVRSGIVDHMPLDRATVITGTLDGVRAAELREMWLHVRTPEGGWRRYPMSTLPAPGGVVGVSVFPVALFDGQGRAAFYLSASTSSGDEFFTEIETATSTR